LNDRYLDRKARSILSKLKPKVIFDLTGVMTSASLIYNSRARQIIGFNRKIFRSIYDIYSEFNLGNHSREIYTNAIKKIIPILEFKFPEKDIIHKINNILICPFAGWKSKEWSLFKFIELAEILNKKYNVILLFDNTHISTETFNYLKNKKINYLKTTTTEDLISEIKKSDLLIGNDSGPVQIAAAFGKYTLSIYGPTNPDYHLPKGENHYFIQKTIPCTPGKGERLCFTDGGKNGCPAFECLSKISVGDVYRIINEIINLTHFKSEN
jgi:heptosyltransferase-2